MLAIIDGSYYLHRALHQPAMRKMRTRAGVLSGGVFGFLRALSYTLNAVQATKAICVWDGRRSKRRKLLFPEYKSKTHKPIEDGFDYLPEYRASREAVIEVLPKLGVRSLCLPRLEGDDTIYRVKRSFRNWRPTEGIMILSEDRDMWQLIDHLCSVYRPHAEEYVTLDNQDARTGVSGTEEYLMWRALSGDSSDHIKGVTGVGDTRAIQLVNEARPLRLAYGWELGEAVKAVAAERKKVKWAQAVVAQWDTVVRNLELMDLRKEPVTHREKQIIRNCVRNPCSMGSPAILYDFLDRFELASLREDMDKWTRPFRKLT